MTKVTEREFFKGLYADPRDIMPRIVNDTYPYRSEWRNQRTGRELFGVTQDVYRNGKNGLTDTEYYVAG